MSTIKNYPTEAEVLAAIEQMRRETGESFTVVYIEVNAPYPGSETTHVRVYCHGCINPDTRGSLPFAMEAFMQSNSKAAKLQKAVELRREAQALEEEALRSKEVA